jgi:hypothetical protein
VSEPIFRSSNWVGAKGERLLSVRLATFAATDRKERDAPKPDLYSAAGERASFELLPVIRLRRKDQQASAHIPSGVPPRQPMRFRAKLTGF